VRRLIAVLAVHRAELARFRDYERAAVRVMAKHGGAIEHAYELAGDDATLRELHVVRFPSDAAFDAYRVDPELAEHAAERAQAVISTEIWPATELPPY
jgi:uncharacterized protein (DUF1330 family)